MVGLEAVGCGNGDSLAKEQAAASSKEDAVKAVSNVASSLRTKLGESLASVQKFDVPIEATTPSLEALKTFSMGVTTQQLSDGQLSWRVLPLSFHGSRLNLWRKLLDLTGAMHD